MLIEHVFSLCASEETVYLDRLRPNTSILEWGLSFSDSFLRSGGLHAYFVHDDC